MEDKFAANFHLLEERGFKVYAQEVAHPSLKDRVDYFRKKYDKFDITLNFDPFVGQYQNKNYPESYSKEELALFGLTEASNSIYNKPPPRRCIAGSCFAWITPEGEAYQCPASELSLGNIYSSISFREEVFTCYQSNCSCPISYFDPLLASRVSNGVDYRID